MKNKLKFIVAIFGITIATFGSINGNAKKAELSDSGHCETSCDTCGYTRDNEPMCGTFVKD